MEKNSFTIGIVGGSGSGKTSFINDLKGLFPAELISVISLDDYYKPRDKQKIDDNGVINFDLPSSIYKKDFYKDVKKLKKGQIVEREEYTFNNEKKKPKIKIFKPAPILILEGLFICHYKKVNEILDLKVHLHAKENLKVIRRIKRDKIERNYPLEDVLYRYQNHVLPSYERFISPYIGEMDLTIINNTNYNKGLFVMAGFIENKLRKMGYPLENKGF